MKTELRCEARSYLARKAPHLHIVPAEPLTGRLKRDAGEALCQSDLPLSDLPVPEGVQVCEECARRCLAYDLPLPEGVDDLPIDHLPRIDQAELYYRKDSKWFGYREGVPFQDRWYRWTALIRRCVCAHCGSEIGEPGDQPVPGLLGVYYRECRGLHPHVIQFAEFDLRRRDGDARKEISIPASEVEQGYRWLQSRSEEVPF